MARNIQRREPSSPFEQKFVEILSLRYPELVERLKAHRVTREDSALLTRLTSESQDMKLAVCLHLAKFAPEGSAPRQYADRHLHHFVEQCFLHDHPHTEALMDGMIAFLAGTPKVMRHYVDLIRSWETTDTLLARVFHTGSGGDSGKSGSGDKGGTGNGGRSEPEGGPPGFDPL